MTEREEWVSGLCLTYRQTDTLVFLEVEKA